MDKASMIAMGYPVGLGLAALGAGIGLGNAVGSAMEAIGRQPEATGKIQINMILGCAFIEALAIYALISPFIAGATFMAGQ
jgi:F-type H+-transporting ATPase subunit c